MAAKNKDRITSKSAHAKAASSARSTPNPTPLTATFTAGFWKEHWLPVVLLIASAFALYSAAIKFGYVLDDQMVCWQNAYVQKGWSGLGQIFGSDSFMGYFQKKENLFLLEGGRYRPLSLATFAMEVGIFGKDHPGISHFINILLYGLTAVMLYRVLLGLFPVKEGGTSLYSVAFIGALIFVLHPLHTEAVANIKGRDEIMALFFSLAALYAGLKYFDTENAGWKWASGGLLLLGLFAKENALTFLAVIPLTIRFFTKVPNRRILQATVPLLIATLVFILVRYKALGFMLDHGKAVKDLMNNPFLGMSASEKLATTFLTLGWYLKLLFVPFPLTHDYYPYHVPKVDWSDWRAYTSLAVYAAMGLLAVWGLKKRRVPAYAILYFLLTLSIVSNLIVSVGTFMNERFTFMPSVAFCILIAWFLAAQLPQWLGERPDRPYLLGTGLLAVIVAAFAWISFNRVPDWKDALSLNGSAVRISEGSARSHCFYVTALYENKYLKTKDPAEKAALVDTMDYHIKRSLEINPEYGSALIMKGAIAAARFEQDHQMDKLFHEFGILLEKIPTNANFRPFFDKYMAYLANNGGNPNKINSFCYQWGYKYFYKEKRDPDNAIKILELALPTQSEDEYVLNALSEVYNATGNTTKAAEMKQRAEASAKVLIR